MTSDKAPPGWCRGEHALWHEGQQVPLWGKRLYDYFICTKKDCGYERWDPAQEEEDGEEDVGGDG